MKNEIIIWKKWLQWFVGFNDAEGNIQMYPKKRVLKSGEISKINVGYSYHLSLHKRDIELIKSVQKRLGDIGSIYQYENKPDVRLAVNDRQGLLYLINNVFNEYSLITKHQLIRYHLVRKGLTDGITEFKTQDLYNKYKSGILLYILNQIEGENRLCRVGDSGIDNWIVGFINGEGSFYLNKNKCNFTLEHTDEIALKIIKERLCFGPNVLERASRTRDIGKERKPTYILIISSKKDINNLIQFLDNTQNVPLQGHKYTQYNEWKTKWIINIRV